jgi:hypothetical protein
MVSRRNRRSQKLESHLRGPGRSPAIEAHAVLEDVVVLEDEPWVSLDMDKM